MKSEEIYLLNLKNKLLQRIDYSLYKSRIFYRLYILQVCWPESKFRSIWSDGKKGNWTHLTGRNIRDIYKEWIQIYSNPYNFEI